MGNDVGGLGESADNPDHGISLLDKPRDNTSLADLIINFPPQEATQSVCRKWITSLAATRELDDKVDQSAIYCLGRDLWDVRSASDAMVLLCDQKQLTEGMKLLLAQDIGATAAQARQKRSKPGENKDTGEECCLLILGIAAFVFFFILIPIYWAKTHPKNEDFRIQ